MPAGFVVAERGLVAAELVPNDRTPLGVLVDLETQDRRARRCLEDNDGIGVDLGQEVVGHDLREPSLDERVSRPGARVQKRADRLDPVEAVAKLGAGAGSGERVVAETTTSAGGDAKGVGSTAAGGGRQDRAFEIAGAIENGETFLGGLTTSVGEGGELSGRRDVGAIEDAQSGRSRVDRKPGSTMTRRDGAGAEVNAPIMGL